MFVLKNSLMFGAVCCALCTSLMIVSSESSTVRASSIASSDARALSPSSSDAAGSNSVRPRAGHIRTREERDDQNCQQSLYSSVLLHYQGLVDEFMDGCEFVHQHEPDRFLQHLQAWVGAHSQRLTTQSRDILSSFARHSGIADDDPHMMTMVHALSADLPESVQQKLYQQVERTNFSDVNSLVYDAPDCLIQVKKIPEHECPGALICVNPLRSGIGGRIDQQACYTQMYERASNAHKQASLSMIFALLSMNMGGHSAHLWELVDTYKEANSPLRASQIIQHKKLQGLVIDFFESGHKQAQMKAFGALLQNQNFEAARLLLVHQADPCNFTSSLPELLTVLRNMTFVALKDRKTRVA